MRTVRDIVWGNDGLNRKLKFFRVMVLSALCTVLVLIPPAWAWAVELTFPEDDAFRVELAGEIAAAMFEFRPDISTYVLSVDETGVFIEAGLHDGSLVGMRFKITSPDGSEPTIIQIDRVEEDYSHGIIISGPPPDHMYGAEYLPEGAWVHYIVPSSELKEKADVFLGLAFAVEAAGGWNVASVGNDKWRYSTPNVEPPPLQTFVCELSFDDRFVGVPAARFVLTAPGGEAFEGGMTYYGDWIPIKQSTAAEDAGNGLFAHEASLPRDTFAIGGADIMGDGVSEIIIACDESLRIYRRVGDYLELRYLHRFKPPKSEPLAFGELGYLGVLRLKDGWRFYIRGPSHSATAVCELKGGAFRDLPVGEVVPVAGVLRGERLILAEPLDTHHLFRGDDIVTVTHIENVTMALPDAFTFLAIGNFDGVPGYETAFLDSGSIPHIYVNGDIFKSGYPFGAGLWGFDIDGDGRDELITTGRKLESDHLDYYEFEGEEFRLAGFSPSFKGNILSVTFADMDGGGMNKPIMLIAFGREKRIIF